MSKYIKGLNCYQVSLFPISLDDYISENNEVRVIDAFVESLNLELLGFKNTTPKNCHPYGKYCNLHDYFCPSIRSFSIISSSFAITSVFFSFSLFLLTPIKAAVILASEPLSKPFFISMDV